MNATPPSPSRSLKFFAAAVKWSLWLLLAMALLFAAAWGALHGWIVPRIGEFRPALEMRASQVLGVPVRIGGISARSEGLFPSFELQDVVLLDPQGREALRLPLVVAAVSPRSLWHLGFEQLYIHAPQLDIRRTADGHFFVAGLDFARASGNEGRGSDWFFSQGEFVIQGGTISWTDEQRGAPTLVLQQVDMVVRNSALRHAIRLDATPPPEWGARFTVQGIFRQPLLTRHAGQWQDWTGEIYSDFAAVDLSQLRRDTDLGIDIAQGHGRVRAWADVEHGQLVGGTADVVLADVRATLGAQLQPVGLQSISGRVGGKRLADGFELQTQGLQFVTEDGTRWPGGNFELTWNRERGEQPAQGELQADRLDLGALSQIASRLPVGDAVHKALQAYAPQGLVERVQAHWHGPLSAPQAYDAHGRVSGLALAAQTDPAGKAGSPGVRGATVDFDLSQASGRAHLAVANGALQFPGVFEDPELPLDTLAADVQWQHDGGRISVSVNNLKFANADAQGEARASWHTAPGQGDARFPGTLDLQGNLSRADGTRVWRYLPVAVGKDARDYVRQAVQAGTASGVKFRVRGDLQRFPFAEGRDGDFSITAQVRDVQFAYVPRTLQPGPVGWPALTQLSGELVFHGNGMQVKGASGRVAGSPQLAVKADAQIPDFRKTEVAVQGQVRGPLAQALAFVNGSPVSGMTNQALAKTRATGDTTVDLKLQLPIDNMARSEVQGTVALPGNDVQFTPDSPQLTRARGSVQFSQKGFQVVGVQAKALGGDFRIDGGSRAGAPNEGFVVQLRAQGTATADGLRQARELGFVARLAREMQGSTSYQLTLGFRRGEAEVMVTSNLQGMAVNLPAPLAKTADSQLPLRYQEALTKESLAAPPPAKLQEMLTVELGRLGSANYLRELGGAEPQVLRGSIAIGLPPGETAALPAQGVAANVQLGAVDASAWQDVITRVFAPDASGSATAATTPVVAVADTSSPSAAQGYLPTALALRARQIGMSGRTLHNVVVNGSRDDRTWRANVNSDELNGLVEFLEPRGNGPGRLHARLSSLKIEASAANQVETLLEQQPASIPALDVVVDDFELKGKRLGRLEIDAINRGPALVAREGGIREWRLNKLTLSMPEAQFTASGNWAAVNAQPGVASRTGEPRRTAMKFKLDIADAGGLLDRLGMKGVLLRGRGTLEGTVGWMGSPLGIDYPSLNGSININVEKGQFLKADPGAARLLGVLSLQSLPRRLSLDFRDVFSSGFAFDFVRGDATIDQGVASTNNLQMKGVNAAVLMEGKADLARETQDLRVVVVPEVNAGTASLVATAINPALGLGSFLAQMFLRQPLMRAATQEFHVDGTWTDPRVTRVARTNGATAAGANAAASAPATR